VAPLGQDYVDVMRKGALEDRWVDVYPNKGKRMGAFSTGAMDTRPFIFMSYNDDIYSMSTLAHELGHSMHSYHARRTQPYVYSNYGLFQAEVASNMHQALTRRHLLATKTDPTFQVAVIEEAMANYYRYFFIMPSLARLELDVHRRVERGVDGAARRAADGGRGHDVAGVSRGGLCHAGVDCGPAREAGPSDGSGDTSPRMGRS